MFVPGAVQVAATAAKILTADDQAHHSVIFYNNGPNPIAIGVDSTVTMATGFIVPAGASLTLDQDKATNNDIWAICSVLQVSPADTRYLVES